MPKSSITSALIAALILASGGLALAVQVNTAAAEDITINKPAAAWSLYGSGQVSGYYKDKGVAGGQAMRVKITTARPDQPWAVGASSPITGKIAKGDKILLAIWAKAESVDGGPATANLTQVAVQLAADPYTPVISGSIEVTGEWTLHHILGVSPADYGAGATNVSLHMAAAKQTVDLGPVIVVNMGPS